MWDELKKLLKHTSVYGIGNLLGKVAGFLLIPFYTRYIRPAEYGMLELLDLSLALVTMLVNVWASAPLIRFYYEYDDESEKRRVVSTALWTAGCVGAILTSLGFGFAANISSLLLKSPDFRFYVQVICISFFLSILNSVAWSYFRAKQRSGFIASLNTVSLVLMLLLSIYFIAVLHLGVLGVLYSSLLANYLLNGVIILVWTVREVGLGFDFRKLRAFALFGAPLIFTNIGAFIMNFSDRFFLQRFSTVSVVGIYALGYKFGFMLSFLLVQPFSMIWSARMYDIARSENRLEMFSRFGAYLCLVLTTGALSMSLVIKDVIKVIAAPDFAVAYRIVPLIAASYVFQGMANYFQTGLLIEKKTGQMGTIGLLGGGVNLLLNFFFISHYVAMGAAWATCLSFLLMAVLSYAFSQKAYKIPYNIPKLCMPIAAAFAVYTASTLVIISSPFLSIVVKLLFFPVFLGVLYFVGFFERDEIERLKSISGVFLGRVAALER